MFIIFGIVKGKVATISYSTMEMYGGVELSTMHS